MYRCHFKLTLETLKKQGMKLNISMVKLRTYSGQYIIPMGEIKVKVTYENQNYIHNFVVVAGKRPNLMGRDLLMKCCLNWQKLFTNKTECVFSIVNDKLQKILNNYEDVCRPELGTMKGVEVAIDVNPDAKLKFLKARPVPYAIKNKIETELERLVNNDVFEAVNFSRWATPIVPVVKLDGTIRICGDYKQTVNRVSNCDKYPVPKTEDLLATLNGGQKFSKLDLSQAYQQLTLDSKSRELLTINTHKGLFQPKRLQFGVHSATGIFQRKMEEGLSHVPFTVVKMDDILITGRNDTEHLSILEQVLHILQEYGLRLKKEKCIFMASEVIYLGFRINREGVAPVPERIESVKQAKSPENVTQVKSFLGMINYYHRHLPNLAEVLEPLHKLLRKGTVWKWGQLEQQSFEKVKSLLCSDRLFYFFFIHFILIRLKYTIKK